MTMAIYDGVNFFLVRQLVLLVNLSVSWTTVKKLLKSINKSSLQSSPKWEGIYEYTQMLQAALHESNMLLNWKSPKP